MTYEIRENRIQVYITDSELDQISTAARVIGSSVSEVAHVLIKRALADLAIDVPTLAANSVG